MTALAAITGTVFRDFNANATKNANEPGIGGISVTAFDNGNANVGSAISQADGSYSLTVSTTGNVRIEFGNIPAYLRPGPAGTVHGTTVTYATDGASGVDLGIANPTDYCQDKPLLATPCYVNGNPLATSGSNPAGNLDVLVDFHYDVSGTLPHPNAVAKGKDIGATWGLAYQRRTKLLFAAAMQKRHSGFGPGGTGAIYKIDKSSAGLPPALLLDLNTLYANPTLTGADPHSGLPGDATQANHDPDSYYQVGKIAFGDIDISEDDDTLYVVSLKDKTLYQINIAGLPGTNPTFNDVRGYPIPDPGCTDGDYQPWAAKAHDSLIYVGVVCSAETSQLPANLSAHVIVFVPGAGLAGAFIPGPVFSFPLTYSRGAVIDGSTDFDAKWRPWISETMRMRSITRGGRLAFDIGVIYPQPILSDIEFDERGRMILGFIDRNGHQTGYRNYNTFGRIAPPSSGTPDKVDRFTGLVSAGTFPNDIVLSGISGGDLLCAAKDSIGNWVLENNAECGGISSSGAGQSPSQGPGTGEYFWQDMFLRSLDKNAGTHEEISLGGLVVVPGKGEVATTVFDPVQSVNSGGVRWFGTTVAPPASLPRSYEVFGDTVVVTFGKAAGLGDLEALCDPAPIEIGNYVWNDLNHNGIQDPGEPGIAAIPVNLYSSTGVFVAATTTSASGQYLFNKGNVLPGGVKPETGYLVAIAPADFPGLPTIPSVGSNRAIDSDGVLQAGAPLIGTVAVALTTGKAGNNDHRYDFGFFVSGCDIDGDSDIDRLDLSAISRARGRTPLPGDPRDADGDGRISPADVKACIPRCTRANCATGQ